MTLDPLLLKYGRSGAWARAGREHERQRLEYAVRLPAPAPSGAGAKASATRAAGSRRRDSGIH
jgi:hypothetical protein